MCPSVIKRLFEVSLKHCCTIQVWNYREEIPNLLLAKIVLCIAPNSLYMFLLKFRIILLCSDEVYLQNDVCAR